MQMREKLQMVRANLPNVWQVSDRRRAVETFEILTAGTEAPVVGLTDSLREINFGDFEGMTWDELPPEFQRDYSACQTNPFELEFPRGETFRELCERVSRGAVAIFSSLFCEAELGIVGHQGSLRIWELMAENAAPAGFFAKPFAAGEARWHRLSLEGIKAWRQKHLKITKRPVYYSAEGSS